MSVLDNSSDKTKSLIAAVQHTTSHWLPCDIGIVNELSKTSREDSSNGGLKLLVQDVGLMTYCLREILDEARLQGKPIKDFYPLEVLKTTNQSLVAEIVERAPRALFHKAGTSRTYEQDRLLLLPVIAAVITQTLAPAVNIDPQIAFTTCLFRQLGLTLVAWNYPRTFMRAVATAQSSGRPIDSCIASALGFTPSSLALAIARAWHIAPEIRNGLGEGYESEKTRTLKNICAIGITLAKTEEPWLETINSDQVASATQEVVKLLGSSGLSELKLAITTFCSKYTLKLGNNLLESITRHHESGTALPTYRFERK